MRPSAAAQHIQYLCKLAAILACLLAVPAVHAQVRRSDVTQRRDVSSLRTAVNNQTSQKSSSSTQRTSPSDSSQIDTSATKGLLYVKETPDSVLRKKVFFFFHKPHTTKIHELWNPTLEPTGAQFSELLDGFNGNYFLGQGTIGHPHLSVYPKMAEGIGFNLQYHGQEGYLKTPETIRFYQTLTPYTVLSYNSSVKKDYLVEVTHTQNIIPGWNVSFNYRLMCPEGNLSGSGAKNHYLDATTNYFSRDSRLQVRAGFIWQSLALEENGGLSDDSYFTDNSTANLSGLPVKLYNSASKNLHHNAFLHATYNFVRQVERTRERDSLVARYDTINADSILLVMDTLVLTDTLRVGTPHIVNLGILGVDADYTRWKRAAYLTNYSDSILWQDISATLFWTNDAYLDYRWHNPLKITIGITPRRLNAIVPKDTALSPDTLLTTAAVNPFAKVELRLWKAILRGEATLDNTLLQLHSNIKNPDFHSHVALAIPFDSVENTTLELSMAFQRQMPEVRMLHASGYTLSPILSQRIRAHFQYNNDKGFFRTIELDANASHLNHNVWYDSTLTPVEGTNDLWLYQAAMTLRMQWRWFHLDMQQILQHSTDEFQAAVPLLASKNSIYTDFSLFRNALRMQIGVDLRYFSLFASDAYDPATGLFYMQDTKVGNCFWADAFINLQIKRASIYVKAGHFNALWESNPHYFLLPHYPSARFGVFWGMTWNFFD